MLDKKKQKRSAVSNKFSLSLEIVFYTGRRSELQYIWDKFNQSHPILRTARHLRFEICS